jgi:hypothetical protein
MRGPVWVIFDQVIELSLRADVRFDQPDSVGAHRMIPIRFRLPVDKRCIIAARERRRSEIEAANGRGQELPALVMFVARCLYRHRQRRGFQRSRR